MNMYSIYKLSDKICISVTRLHADVMFSIYKYTWAPQTVHNTPVVNILKVFFV